MNSEILFPFVKIIEENKEKLEISEIRSTLRHNTRVTGRYNILYFYRKRLHEKLTEHIHDTMLY